MSQGTRRKVRWLVIAALVLVPADVAMVVLLRGVTGNPPQAWASGLSHVERTAAIATIHRYPVEYRRELLRSASPVERAGVWRRAIDGYVGAHRQLTPAQRDALATVRAMLTPELFSGNRPSTANLDRLTAAGNEVVRQLGDADARFLMKDLGPVDTSDRELPLLIRAADWLRRHQSASAVTECDCSSDSDWCLLNSYCAHAYPYCWADCSVWPGCGWFYMYCCDGKCTPRPRE